jgi:FKBP-type peptidyl-prolyl cis-trans isomerase
MHRVIASALISFVAALLVGCSSSADDQPVQDPTFGPSAAAAGATSSAPSSSSTAANATVATGAVATASAGAADAPGVPAVSGASDLAKQPVIAAGTGAPSAVTVRDLVAGTGATIPATATVTLKYVGALFSTGVVFDASWGHTGSAGADETSFALSKVIPGFAQGIIGMKVGGRREIVIPPAQGYGATATGSIPANSTLVFVVDIASSTG